MEKLVVANWKMNPSTEKEAVEIFSAVKEGIKGANAEVIICPPFVYLPILKGLTLGAQNVFYEEEGAFTGEVSPKQLKDLGVKYVIIGHSEARKYLNETDEIINKKIKECFISGLKPILCVGEKEGENKLEILKRQMKVALSGISNFKFQISNLAIAYEPVWAIGTGNNCSVQETMESVLFIRKIVERLYDKNVAENMKVLYGGSVSVENASEYLKHGGVNGLLVGGASLDAEEFIKIVKSSE